MRCNHIFIVLLMLVPASLFAQSDGDYRSAGTGNWNSVGSWEVFSGGWTAASSTPTSADGAITIQTGHTITVTASVTVDEVTIESSAILTVSGASTTLTIANSAGTDVLNNGTFSAGSGNITFNQNTQYDHSVDGGSLPTATWHSTSTCRISGVTNTFPSNIGQAFGNMIYSSSGQLSTKSMGFSGTSTSFAGDLTIGNTGTRLLLGTNSSSTTVTIAGDLVISNAAYFAITTTGSNVIFDVEGDLNKTSSRVFSLATSGSGFLYLAGDLSHTNSAQISGNSSSELRFDGSSLQTISGSGTYSAVDFRVANDSEIDIGTSTLNGSGTFTSGTNCVIHLGSTAGAGAIANSSSANISVSGSKFFDPSSTLIFNGAAAQTMGNLFPSSQRVDVEIDNSSGVSGGTGTRSIGALTITSGTFTAPATLNVEDDFTNNGTFTAGTGTVVFDGSAAQDISGTITFNNITVSNTTGVNNEGTLTLDGLFTQSGTGSFDADGSANNRSFTISSGSGANDGRIGTLGTPANFTGDITVERYVSSPADWRNFAIPVSGITAADIQGVFPVTGKYSNASPTSTDGVGTVNNVASINAYGIGDSSNDWIPIGESGGATSTHSLNIGTGYIMYTFFTSGARTLSLTGAPGKGSEAVTLTTGQYNLVGNPYPAAIDWDNLDLTNVGSIVISMRRGSGDWSTKVQNGLVTNELYSGWSGEIATGQSFWINNTGGTATSITFQEDDKISSSGQFTRETNEINDYIRITLTNDSERDETILMFREDATEGADRDYDAPKRNNAGFDLSIIAMDESEYTITAVPLISCEKEYKLNVKDVNTGRYGLEFTDMETFYLPYKIEVVDNYLETTTEVVNNDTYEFEVTSDPESKGDSRFTLRISSSEEDPVVTAVENGTNCEAGSIVISASSNIEAGSFNWYESMESMEPIADAHTAEFITPELSESRSYFVTALNNAGCESGERIEVFAEINELDIPEISNEDNQLTTNIADGEIQWYRDGEAIEGATSSTYEAEISGSYTVKNSSGECEIFSSALVLEITSIFDPEFGDISVYPNPTTELITFSLGKGNTGNVSIELLDINGKMIIGPGVNEKDIDWDRNIINVKNVESGLYMLNVRREGKTTSIRVIKK